jgi:hypothetical protein
MADDVKVKFGGDFTDVAKGAGEAVNKAGGALSAWFGDFNKATMASMASALALSTLFGKFAESMGAALKTAKGLDDAFKRFGTGKSSQEFQLLARYGAEVGVSMEAVGRTMNYFAKVNDAAAKGSESHRAVLRSLKFSEDEVTKGKVSAIEVLRRLADEYDRTGLESLSAQRAVQLFGLQGEQLSAIYKNGKLNLDEFTKSVVLMSDKTVESMAKTERRIERFKRGLEGVGGGTASGLGLLSAKIEGADVAQEVMGGQLGKTGGTAEQEGRSIGSQIYSEVKGDPDAVNAALEQLRDNFTDSIFLSAETEATAKNAIKTILEMRKKDMEKEEKKGQPEGPPLLQAARVMAASSLQEIGGGDVSSILSGTYQSSMLDAANKTADNTGKLVQESSKPAQTKPVNVAK